MSGRNDPINPFSPICLIEPTLPQCKTYISGVGPANCPGVTPNCKRELFRLNSTISLDLDFAIYVEHNLQCALQEIQPCWEPNTSSLVGINTGRFKQGSCNLNCKNNLTRFQQHCHNESGFICDSQYNLGLDGTELKVHLPICLPAACNFHPNDPKSDLFAIQKCMTQHTCESSPELRKLIPECTVSLECMSEFNPYPDVVLGLLISVGLFAIIAIGLKSGFFSFLGRCFGCQKTTTSTTSTAPSYYVSEELSMTSSPNRDPQENNTDTSLTEPLILNDGGSRYVLSDALADQQVHGRFALGTRQNKTVSSASMSGSSSTTTTASASPSSTIYQVGSSLTFRNLFFRYLDRRTVLRGVSGILQRGSCVAVIGAPDSGVTTLLRCLAGRQPKGILEGSLLIDGRPPDKTLRRIVAFIPKEDINHPLLTVRECFEFSALCRLPYSVGFKERSGRVEAWLQLLGLSHCADNIVGNATIRGVSGGERRRVSIGVNAVAGHRLVIADSPTNGLDSGAAFNVCKTMRALADAQHNGFMVSIRQPSEPLLKLFDTICLMSRGKCIYWGSLNDALPFFVQLGFSKPITKSLPDFLEELTGDPTKFVSIDDETKENIHVESKDSTETKQKSTKKSKNTSIKHVVNDIRRQFVKSDLYQQLGTDMWNAVDEAARMNNEEEEEKDGMHSSDICPHALLDDDGKFVCSSERYSTGFCKQTSIVCARQVRLTSRSPTLRARLGRALFQGFLLGTMFYKFDQSQESANNRFGALFISLSAIVMGSVSTIPELYAQRRVFYVERQSGYFRPAVWQLSLVLTELPIAMVEMMAYSLLLYGLCGLRNGIFSLAFLYFYSAMVVMCMICWSIAASAVMLSDSVVAAQALVPVYNAANLLFSGYLLSAKDVPSYLSWLMVTSTVTRPFIGIAINEMKDQIFHCNDNERIPFENNPALHLPAPIGYNNEHYRACPLQTGDDALNYLYGIDPKQYDIWNLFIFSVEYFFVFQIVLALAITFVDHSKSQSDDPASKIQRSRKKQSSDTNATNAAIQTNDDIEEQQLNYNSSDSATSTSISTSTELRFNNLSYSVTLPNGKSIQILKKVSGTVKPGQVVALMGPSGAGKTTLLDVIAGVKTGGIIEGTITLNDALKDETFARYAGYCEQMDSHMPTLTVREALQMSASLRLDASDMERTANVDRVIQQLLLEGYQHQLIGTPGLDGVAPEVRKLVTIGVELVCSPKVLFLDEPTTGLDSSSALATMKLAQTIARSNGIAVICTIHQPACEIFELFDTLLLLQKGGRVAYFGSVAAMEKYFINVCGCEAIEEGKNPADYSLECASKTNFHSGNAMQILRQHGDETVTYPTAADAYEAHQKLTTVPTESSINHTQDEDYDHHNDDDNTATYQSAYATSSWQQFNVLLGVYFKLHFRDTKVFNTRMLLAVVFGAMVGVLFFGVGNDQVGAKARISVIFISLVYAGNVATMSIPTMVMTRPIVFRERGSHAYRLCPYYWAVLVAEVPFVIVQATLFVSTFYFLVGFQSDLQHFLVFEIGFVLLSLLTYSFSHLMASVAPNADVGTILSATIQSVFTLFCGFLLPYESIPSYWRPLYYLSMFRYPLDFFVSNELVGLNFNCPNGNSTVGNNLPVGAFPVFVGGLATKRSWPPPPRGNGEYALECLPIVGNFTNLHDERCWKFFCPINTGEFVLNRYNMPTDASGMWNQLYFMVVFFGALRGLTFVALGTIQHIKR